MRKYKVSSLKRQVSSELKKKCRFGSSKHLGKINGEADKYIYSHSTYNSYCKHMISFGKYCREVHGEVNIKNCKQYVNEYIESRGHLSASTLKLDMSAINKFYGTSNADYGVNVKNRSRGSVKRSRGSVKSDVRFNEKKHSDLVNFCKATGLRRSELENLRWRDIAFHDGYCSVHVQSGKGGRSRDVLVLERYEGFMRDFNEALRKSDDDKVFESVHTNADIHSYRADYASQMYLDTARPVSDIPKNERYYCRNDMKGVILDKSAMKFVSELLGHSRINVIAQSYLHKL